MIKVRCPVCQNAYPAGSEHECFGHLSLADPTLSKLGDRTPEFVAKAVAFYEAHLKRSREGMRKVRKNKSLKEKGE